MVASGRRRERVSDGGSLRRTLLTVVRHQVPPQHIGSTQECDQDAHYTVALDEIKAQVALCDPLL